MWVYQKEEHPAELLQCSARNALILPDKPLTTPEEQQQPAEQDTGTASAPTRLAYKAQAKPRGAAKAAPLIEHTKQQPVVRQGEQRPDRLSRTRLFPASRDCLLLAAAYLLGTFSAGLLQALCNAGELDVLGAYIKNWQQLFAAKSAAQAVGLFGAELLTVLGALSVLLVLGLSAVGPLPIYLFVMLYGTGAGLLLTQLTAGISGWQLLLTALLSGAPTAAATGVLCLFGASALRVSNRLHIFSFGKREEPLPHSIGAPLLLGQFALSGLAFLPLCGAAVCMAYLSAQLG